MKNNKRNIKSFRSALYPQKLHLHTKRITKDNMYILYFHTKRVSRHHFLSSTKQSYFE